LCEKTATQHGERDRELSNLRARKRASERASERAGPCRAAPTTVEKSRKIAAWRGTVPLACSGTTFGAQKTAVDVKQRSMNGVSINDFVDEWGVDQ
jgi:hypothetical protein